VQARAEEEAAKARESALAEAALERDRVLSDLRGQIAGLAIAAAQRLIGEALDERRQRINRGVLLWCARWQGDRPGR
jgi:F-type H+-transporting ATPase subunit b